MRPEKPGPSVTKYSIHGGKCVFCMWWTKKSAVYNELYQTRQIINGERWQKTINLFDEFKKNIQNKAERQDKSVLQSNNDRPLAARLISSTLETLRRDMLPSPLYLPDVTSSNYYLFRSMPSTFLKRNSVLMQESEIGLMMSFATK